MHSQALRQADVRFTRKEVRLLTGWGDTQLRVHLARLVSLEYLLAHHSGAGGRFAYELLYDGDAADGVHLSGLIDAASIADATTAAKSRGPQAEVAGRLRADRGVVAAPSRGEPMAANPVLKLVSEDRHENSASTHIPRPNGQHPPYVPALPAGTGQ
jgi:hypothetical protein